jgi:aryl-alcohol dehydrogenase-like predicted oxidoreductase
MEYRPLGTTGIRVSTLCLGTMMFGAWGNPDRLECAGMLDLALESGINFVDTADVYAFGESEEILGEALRGRREHVVLASKVNNRMSPEPNHAGNSRRWIVRSLEGSLRRLRTDHLDLYQVHRPDPDTDVDETLGALSDLVRQGKVRAIGTSTFPAEALVEAHWTAERRRRERFSTEQPPYSVFARGIEADVLPVCERHRIGVVVWSPLNGGWLTGKYKRGQAAPEGSRAVREPEHFDFQAPAREVKLDLVDELTRLAASIGASLTHLAIAFVLSHRAVSSAIVGPRTPAQLADALGAEKLVLDDDVLRAIDALVPPGTTLNPRDRGYIAPALTRKGLRRRDR